MKREKQIPYEMKKAILLLSLREKHPEKKI